MLCATLKYVCDFQIIANSTNQVYLFQRHQQYSKYNISSFFLMTDVVLKVSIFGYRLHRNWCDIQAVQQSISL